MRHLTYLALLAGCLVGTAPLEIVLRTRVYSRWRRLVLALLPGVALGVSWDLYALHAGHWSFDERYVTGITLDRLPIEEVLFFIVIPICAVLTLEAVRRCRPGWLPGRGGSDGAIGVRGPDGGIGVRGPDGGIGAHGPDGGIGAHGPDGGIVVRESNPGPEDPIAMDRPAVEGDTR